MKRSILILPILLVGLTTFTSKSKALDIERDALIALYNSTNGPGWDSNTGWGTADPYCNWFGVTCDSNEHVIRLLLGINNLKGPIPPELGNLSSLEVLYLPSNQLNGTIPATMSNLGNLQVLDLSGNQLTGPIPPELGNLSSLDYLWLTDNQLSGFIPPELGDLSSLKELILDNNQLNDPIPKELSNLSSLRLLSLSSNPTLSCWETVAALIWAQGLPTYEGPNTVCALVPRIWIPNVIGH